ncbi:hypothetical protein DFH08DRAFT_993384 [Mycena albidolilacea]|uniref:C2H2-type domain-containing protein n=1 Tax=Mycena albidolilacea TaxID=1033008 RepID=A0AAD7E7Z5_9AGAR|nr:hypothetical protein DFH08DRAFT_993384 [Mycena albidolilacea]
MHQDQDYIAEGDFQPGGSPDNEFRIQLDPHDDDPAVASYNVLGSPAFPHTPSYNGSYHNSPYSNHSELSFSGDPTQDSFALFDDEPGQQQGRDGYDPAEYDAPQAGGGLLMFNDSDYMSGPGPYVSSVPVGPAPDRHRSYDYSSPNSSDGGEEQQVHQQRHQSRSRASSIASNHHQQPQSSPRMNVAQAFDNMTFRSPNWGTEPLPLPRSPRAASPHMQQQQKPQSPPRLLMPDDNSGPSNFDPPTINAPEGDGLGAGPRLHIVPATPVSGGGAAGGAGVPGFQETLHQVTEQQDEYRAEQQQLNAYDPPAPAQPSGHRRTGSNASVHSNSNSPFLFPSNMLPGPGPRPRSASDHALEPPNSFIGQMGNIGSALDDSMGDVILPPQGQHRRYDSGGGSLSPSPHRSSFGGAGGGGYAQAPGSAGLDNGFLSPDLGMGFGGFGGGGLGLGLGPGGGGAVGLRRAKSDAAGRGHVRQSRSEDIRGTGTSGTMFPSEDFMRGGGGHGQFLSPVEPPPAIRSGGQGARGYHHRSASGGSVRSERGGMGGHGHGEWSAASSTRVSPYPSPNVSPSPHYADLPDPNAPFGPGSSFGPGGSAFNNDGNSPPIVVSKQNVTTLRTSKASHNRRKQEATFVCPVPNCGSTFTRSFNLKGHIRSHNEEKPFVCKWPGCGKGFARQHDCKRHEQLHTNYRPFVCGGGESGAGGCGKMFARMDALNRHLRSEGGAECQRTLEANGRLPDFSGGGLMPEAGGGRARSYSTGSTGGEGPPQLRMGGGGMGVPKTEDPWANMNGVAL